MYKNSTGTTSIIQASGMTERWVNDDRIFIFGWAVNWLLAGKSGTPEVQRQRVNWQESERNETQD